MLRHPSTITNSWPISKSPRRRPPRPRPPLRPQPPPRWRLANRQSPRLVDRRNLAEDVIEQQAAACRQRNPLAGAPHVARGDQSLNAGPIDDLWQAVTVSNRVSVDA